MRNLLEAFGASDKESAIFLKLLELGPQPVSVVASHVGIPRPSMYVVLDRLKKLQLIEEFKHNGMLYVKCISVSEMEDILKLKGMELRRMSVMLEENKKHLLSLENRLSSTPIVKFYQGKKEIMRMYEKLLKEGGFCAIFTPQLVKRLVPEYHYKIGETINKNKWETREFAVDSEEAHEYKQLFETKVHGIKILPKEMHFAADIIIFPSKIYMISYGEVDLTGTEIISTSLAQAQRVIFDHLWKTIPQVASLQTPRPS